MNREVEFHWRARAELRNVVAWYQARSQRAASQFLIQMDRAVIRLADDPESLPRMGKRYRSLRVGKFPFLIVFLQRLDLSVFVVAVAHTSRRSGYWRGRKP